jgi:hypothetical protein
MTGQVLDIFEQRIIEQSSYVGGAEAVDEALAH